MAIFDPRHVLFFLIYGILVVVGAPFLAEKMRDFNAEMQESEITTLRENGYTELGSYTKTEETMSGMGPGIGPGSWSFDKRTVKYTVFGTKDGKYSYVDTAEPARRK